MDWARGARRARVAIGMEISGVMEPASGEVVADAAMDPVCVSRRARVAIGMEDSFAREPASGGVIAVDPVCVSGRALAAIEMDVSGALGSASNAAMERVRTPMLARESCPHSSVAQLG